MPTRRQWRRVVRDSEAQVDKVRDIVTEMPVMEYYEAIEMGPGREAGEGTHAGVTTVQVQPGKMDELVSVVRESLVPAVIPQRFQGRLFLADRDTGKAMMIGLWETEAHATRLATSGSYQEQMAKVADLLSGPGRTDLYEVSLLM